MSKQTLAPPVDRNDVVPALAAALRFLGHEPPPRLEKATVRDFWKWALQNWSIERVPRARSRPAAAD